MVKKSSEGRTALELAHKACVEGYDFSNLMREYFAQLGALFQAINKVDGDKYSNIAHLSELGRYLCDDWANSADLSRESLKEHFESFHALLYAKDISHD